MENNSINIEEIVKQVLADMKGVQAPAKASPAKAASTEIPAKARVAMLVEKGRFEFGGSTIILLLQHGKVRLDHDLLENTEEGYETIVKMGERIGETRKRQHGAVSADVSQ